MGRRTLRKFFQDQFTALPPVSDYSTDLTGKTVLVVGANVGLGLEASRHFARMNPGRLIMACRNMDKAEKAMESVRKTTGCQNIETWHVDLSDFNTVRAFADKYEQDGGARLDLLIMNAGATSYEYRQSVDGWEAILQTNHLGISFLTLLLLPYLKNAPLSSPTPRIVLVASEAHGYLSSIKEAQSPQILEKLNDEQYCTRAVMLERYWVTKLFNVFFVRSMASRLPIPSSSSPSLTATCVNPGWCKSQINREIKWTLEACAVWILGPILFRSTEMGSRTLVWAALAGEDAGREVHGRYTASCRVEEESDFALSDDGREVEQRVWTETIAVLSKLDPRVERIVQEYLDLV